jgi:8-hydroxy-5-deazaflavin:NADPH oxidoreductase
VAIDYGETAVTVRGHSAHGCGARIPEGANFTSQFGHEPCFLQSWLAVFIRVEKSAPLRSQVQSHNRTSWHAAGTGPELEAQKGRRISGERCGGGHLGIEGRHGEVLVWTVRETEVGRVLQDTSLIKGKVIVDINNRDYEDLRGGSWFARSIAENLQSQSPESRVVKALNGIPMEALDTSPASLRSAGGQAFIAGDEVVAKQMVSELLGQLGFEAIDLGGGAVAMRAAEVLGDVIRFLIIDRGYGMRANLQLRLLPEPDLNTFGTRAASQYR